MPDWTNEQKQVISSRGQDLLVSAAAGSGKTAVLVQRILDKILDPDSGIEIDRLLVVTFTNAAAASLREKIRLRLEEESASEDPARAHTARRQLSMLAGDHIETIDRFCREIVLDHADALEIDPSFRIADEGELKLLQSEVVSLVIGESLEDPSEEWRKDFRDFARLYAPGKTDEKLEELILDFYEFSMSHEFPGLWRRSCAQQYRGRTDDAPWMQDLTERLGIRLKEMHASLQEGLALCHRKDGGPYHYAKAMADHTALVERLTRCSSMEEYAGCMSDYPWPRPGSRQGKNAPPVDASLEKQVKDIRRSVKDELDGIVERFFSASEEVLEAARLSTARYMDVLVRLTDRFEELFSREKRARNIADFADVAHWALRVLIRVAEDGTPVQGTEGSYERTALAKEYAAYFREIYIDEYQDSNRVQEILLQSIASPGGRFMVGDMKQSIYRFRMADPRIFLEKAKTFRTEESAGQRRIDLHSNFRSRVQVLDAVNLIFRQIMRREIGGVEYSQDQELRGGYPYPDCHPQGYSTEEAADSGAARSECADSTDSKENEMLPELILIEQDDVPDATDRIEAEAAAVAQRILSMVGRLPVYHKETHGYAPAGFGDITILLRTAAGWAETFSRVLDEYGIPNRPDASTGYFDSTEVRMVLSYLHVLDNPRQDIPLAASLRSVIGGLDDRSLAMICARTKSGSLYDRILDFCRDEQGADPGIRRRLMHVMEMTDSLRTCVKDTPIHILLWKIFDETGVEMHVGMTPGGRQKKANLALLVDMAMAYEETSYRGLFHFIRYIEKLRKSQKDIGQAPESSGRENLVRIMTMHKSKGLEFPVVFVSGLNKRFNLQDTKGTLVLHERLGAGLDCRDPERRVRIPNRIENVISGRIRTDSVAEEMRVLYVAMTRAEQKLILTGCADSRQKAAEKAMTCRRCRQQKLPAGMTEASSSMLDWILMPLARHEAERDFFDSGRWSGPEFTGNEAAHLPGRILIRTGREVMSEQERLRKEKGSRLEDLFSADPDQVTDPALHSRLEYMLSRGYRWAQGRDHMPGKLSVSGLKHEAYEEEMRRLRELSASDEDTGGRLFSEQDTRAGEVPVPEFMKQDGGPRAPHGTDVGTAYHLVLASLDFAKDRTGEHVQARLESMLKCDKIQKEEADALETGKIEKLLSSELGERMRSAALKGLLWREQPFVIGRSADRIRPQWSPEETILIQGIIDAFFFEEDQVVLVDYKSDRAKPGDEDSLVRRYRMQFRLYADALEKLLQCRVKEAWLYSLSLGKAVPVDLAQT